MAQNQIIIILAEYFPPLLSVITFDYAAGTCVFSSLALREPKHGREKTQKKSFHLAKLPPEKFFAFGLVFLSGSLGNY